MNSSFGSSLQGCWILLSWSSPRKIWFFWSESVLLSTLNKWIKLNFPDFPSDIHLICAYCRSAGRRFLFCRRSRVLPKPFLIPDFFVFWLDAVNAETLDSKMPLKQKWMDLRLLLEVCAAHSHSKMTQQDGRVLRFTSSAVSRASILSQFK